MLRNEYRIPLAHFGTCFWNVIFSFNPSCFFNYQIMFHYYQIGNMTSYPLFGIKTGTVVFFVIHLLFLPVFQLDNKPQFSPICLQGARVMSHWQDSSTCTILASPSQANRHLCVNNIYFKGLLQLSI